MKIVLAIVAMAFALSVEAAFELPKAGAKALGVTRGKKFSSGIVFVNGKYLPPPYTVERWGTGIRINSRPVTGEIISWEEFIKTQSGVKVTKTVSEVPEAAPSESPTAEAQSVPAVSGEEDEDESALDDLFDDDPKPKAPVADKSKSKPEVKKPVVRKAPPKPKTQINYSFDGEFSPNETTKAYVKKINAQRTDIDRTLRSGGFVCFGERYSRLTGDERTANEMIEKLPELMQRAESAEGFRNSVRAAGLVFLPNEFCDELYRNRIDYLRLQERRTELQKEREWNKLLNRTIE